MSRSRIVSAYLRSHTLTLALVFLAPLSLVAAEVDATWQGGFSNWEDPGNWDIGVVPNNNGDTYSVFIDTPFAGVMLQSDVSIDALSMTNSSPFLYLDTGGVLNVVGGGNIPNTGTISFNNGGILRLNNGASLNGNIEMFDGTIESTAGGPHSVTLNAFVTSSGGHIDNLNISTNGTFEALGGTLAFGGTSLNGSAIYMAFENSGILLHGGTSITMGQFYSVDNGALYISDPVGGATTASLTGFFAQGQIVVNPGSTLEIVSNLHNEGTVVAQAGSTIIGIDNPGFSGNGGVLTLENGATLTVDLEGNGITNADGYTIEGTTGGGRIEFVNGSISNFGRIEGRDGYLEITGGSSIFNDNTTGVIHAHDQSGVFLHGPDVHVVNGTLSSDGTGAIYIGNPNGDGGVANLWNLAITGTVIVQSPVGAEDAQLILRGTTIHNTGRIEVESGASVLFAENGASLTGDGVVHLDGGEIANFSNPFTNDGNTIEGGANGGLISNVSIVNNGTLQGNGGYLQFEGEQLFQAVLDNSGGGTVHGKDNSAVYFGHNAVVVGGTFTTEGSGYIAIGDIFQSVNPEVLLDGSTTAITNLGTMRVIDAFLSLEGTIDNQGTITYANDDQTVMDLRIVGDVELTGGGTFGIGGAVVKDGGSGKVINVDNIIEAAPTAHPDSFGSFHEIEVRNTGILQANQSRLTFSDSMVDNTGGIIRALDSSIVQVGASAHIVGGTLDSFGSGYIEVPTNIAGGGHTAYFEDLTNQGRLVIGDRSTAFLIGDIHNTGTIRAEQIGVPIGWPARISNEGDVNLTGGGDIELHSGLLRSSESTPGATLTSDNTISAVGGTFSNINSIILNNQGIIQADGAGLILSGADTLIDNTGGGMIRALDNSLVHLQDDVTIRGGTLATTGSGDIRVETSTGSATSAILDGVTNADRLTIVNGSDVSLGISGIFINDGQLHNDGTITGTTVFNDAGATITGNGVINANIINDGTINPGSSPGTLTIDGDFLQTVDGVLVIEMQGINPGEFDVLDITGSAQLEGTIQFVGLGGYEPTLDDVFEVIVYDSLTSANVTFAGLRMGAVELVPLFTADGLFMTVIPEPGPVALLAAVALSLAVRRRRRRIAGARR